jgi:hypothetical protein
MVERSVLVKTLIPAAALALVVALGGVYGLATGLLATAGAMLLGAIALLWSSVQRLTGQTPMSLDEALGMAVPSAEEERKRAVLRALKDLEYERSVGKISEEDYRELSSRYRQEAKILLRALDERAEPAHDRVERLLEKRLRKRGLLVEDSPAQAAEPVEAPPQKRPDEEADTVEPVSAEAADTDTGDEVEEPAERSRATRRCAECATRNDLDATFCKSCGQRLAPKGQQLCSACPAVFDSDDDECPECGVEARPA